VAPVTLHYVGIDEAGYGPMLGPLCVGAAAFRIESWSPDGHAPDLWDTLSEAVSKLPREAKGRIAFNDSKKLKLPNNSVKRHPLTHLERGVLTLLPGGLVAEEPALFEALGVQLDDSPWYGDQWASDRLPVSTDPASLAIDRNALHTAMQRSGVRAHSLSCEVRCEAQFNEQCQTMGSKAGVNGSCVSQHIAEHVEADAEMIRIVCDRQSGRSDYRRLVEAGAGGRAVEVLAQTPSISAYRLSDPWRDIVVRFEVEAEVAHLPVAAASMTAKYVRELAMGRFNRFWGNRIPELKPTAGYTTDARRWLAEVGAQATSDERTRMIRRS